MRRHNCAAANGMMSSGAMRARICAKVHSPLPVNDSTTGAATAMAMLHSRLYVAMVATSAPSMPAMTTAAMATGAKIHIMAPCATTVFRGRRARYMATHPAICIASSHTCSIEGHISRGLTRQKVTKSMRKMSTGVTMCPDQSSMDATGRHSTAPTTIAKGMAMVFTLRCRHSCMCIAVRY